MAEPESLRQIAHSRTPFSTWVGVILLFSLFGLIVLAVVGPSSRGDKYEQTRAKAREEKLKTAREEDTKALTTYAWVDKNKGVARIPIERAMELTRLDLAQKKPAVAGPIIATPEPQASAVPSGAPAATPAPSASPSPTGTPKPIAVEGPDSAIHNQPAAAANPANALPGTQPGANATPAASPLPVAKPPVSPSPAATSSPPGSPLPVPGKTPGTI